MDTLFRIRILCRHLRTIWLRARSIFLSISLRFRRFRAANANNQGGTSTSTPTISGTTINMTTTTTNTTTGTTAATTTRLHRPPSPMPAAKTRVYQWVCACMRGLKAPVVMIREHGTARKSKTMTTTKQTTYTRMGMAAVVPSKEDLAGVTGKYCEDDVEEEDEEGEEVIRDITEAQGDDPDAFEAIFKSLSSSPTLRLDAWRHYGSPFSLPPFSPSLSLPSPVLREPESLPYALPIPSPTMSSASSSSASRDTSAPATPITPTPLGFLRQHPHPRARGHFRTFSASIVARSPLSLSFPLSLSLPLAARRASTPGGTAMHRYMNEDRDEDDGGREGEREDEDEDPFGTYGRAYYAPGARAALGLGDAYDMSAWTWARDCAPYRSDGGTKGKRYLRAQQCCGVHADSTITKVGPGLGHVYRAPIHATSAPQLSSAQPPDRELECLRALAKATARGSVARPPGPESGGANPRSRARSGIRPLLLPQKLGLTGAGAGGDAPVCETDKIKVDAVTVSGRRRGEANGWELDLERGVFYGDGAEA